MSWWNKNKKIVFWTFTGLLLSIVLIVTLLALLGPTLAGPGKLCTLIGCASGIKVELSDLPPSSSYQMTVMFPSGETQTLFCEPNETEAAAPFGNGCTPKGAYFSLDNDTEPKEITVVVIVDGKRVLEVFHPEYEKYQPNGEDCPPTCYSAQIEMNIIQ